MICGANSRCNCSSDGIWQLEFDFEELFNCACKQRRSMIRYFGDPLPSPTLRRAKGDRPSLTTQTRLSALISGAPEKCAPVEFSDRARRNFAGRARCIARRLTNRAPDTRRLPLAQIRQSAHRQMNSAFERDPDSPQQE